MGSGPSAQTPEHSKGEVKVVTWPETEVYPGQVAKATHTYGSGSLANTQVSSQRRQKPTAWKLGRP